MNAYPPHVFPLSRRQLLQAGLTLALAACQAPEPLLRIGSNGWPGYLFIAWAADSYALSSKQVRLLRISSATSSLRALSAGMLDGACLTLDEVISALAEGIPLKVIAVLDVSHGGDVVLGRGEIRSLGQLAGRRIGVEASAVGAVMLDAMLQRAGLSRAQVIPVPVLLDQHEAAFASGSIDALVTMEPQASRLRLRGAHTLFSSADIPGRIVDVLAVREEVLGVARQGLQALVDSHFAMLDKFASQRSEAYAYMAAQMGVSHAELTPIFAGLRLPGRQENLRWLGGKLDDEARNLANVMSRAGLLPRPVQLGRLAVPDFVEGGR
ncbi:ABC transporter substrate-binding protein [Vogesella sp. DC21W]|uniref:ABC transporter substrate-binding protein n=1 Tax=Vogesella aquatica TaxID=2984206 RepID=A0ABT5IVX3_9NEIS|nr:ABC transporter substrate-binding protein [Vogesella aquatica]MDC7716729.1 ABC transporter substrate-binding protein [Vogesella aquatica]